ncbi:MAG: gamma-glutamyltransferase [Ferrovum sp.]|nr:gamma-glutamyltransferase [Ferrovum sp.]NDU88214.1 gamma-glutamyltransferase [Ferrovum sp.]
MALFFWVLQVSVVEAQGTAVVATSHPLATQAGAWALQQGGDAVDAAAAIQYALNVVEPQSSGLGGGAFMVIYRAATRQVYALDAREIAPAVATADQFARLDYYPASISGLAVGVPGTLAGFEALRQRWGHLSLAQQVSRALRYARDGIVITPYLAHALQSSRAALQPEARALTRDSKGGVRQLGQRWRQPDLAHTFELLGRQGAEVFYRGEIAQAMVATQQRSQAGAAGRGRMTLDDLAHYQVRWRTPVEGDYRGYHIVTMPPPSSGGVALLQVLGELDRFHLGQAPGLLVGEPDQMHLTLEALRLAMADRAYWLGDPEATAVPVKALLAPAYLASQSRRLNRKLRQPTVVKGEMPEGNNTTQFTVVDSEGNVVSCTSTVEAPWGSGLVVPGYGFFLNSELTDFNLQPQQQGKNPGANDVRPGRRPRSSMTPTLIFRGGRWLSAYGSPGGVSIISTVVEMTQDQLDEGLGAAAAIALPRFAVLDAAGHTLVESGLSSSIRAKLLSRGHLLEESPDPLGSVQWVGIDQDNGSLQGAADPRRDGSVVRIPPKGSEKLLSP